MTREQCVIVSKVQRRSRVTVGIQPSASVSILSISFFCCVLSSKHTGFPHGVPVAVERIDFGLFGIAGRNAWNIL